MIVKPLYTPRYVPTGNEVAVFETSKGTIRARLFGKDAPVTVGNFVELAQKGFYDHQNFHGRVEGDVVVGGCPVTRPLRPQQVRMAVRGQLRQLPGPQLRHYRRQQLREHGVGPHRRPSLRRFGALGQEVVPQPDDAARRALPPCGARAHLRPGPVGRWRPAGPQP